MIKGRADVFIELKGAAIEREVVDVVRTLRAGALRAPQLRSRAGCPRARARARASRWHSLRPPRADPVAAMRAADALDVWPSREHVNESLVESVHEAGGRVIPWTVNDGRAGGRAGRAWCRRTVHGFHAGAARRALGYLERHSRWRRLWCRVYVPLTHRSSRQAEARPAMRIVVALAAALSVLACAPAKASQAPAPKMAATGDSAHSKDSEGYHDGGPRRALGAECRSVSEHVQAVPVARRPSSRTSRSSRPPARASRNGAILLQDGKIAAVGATRECAGGCVVIDGTGKFVTPGHHRRSLAPRRLPGAGRRGEQRWQRGDAVR